MFRTVATVIAMLMPATAMASNVSLYAAGSLKAALTEVAANYASATGTAVNTTFAPSGLLRERIENGEEAHVFASANMRHPRTLHEAGKAGPVTMFARNQLCALAQPDVQVSTDTLLDVLLDPETSIGTSTPKADPSGDYAWALFGKAGDLRSGAKETLENKAQQLTGGPTSEKAPEGRNPYGWVMETKAPDVFLTYCTNAVLAKKELPELQIVQVPKTLAVGAEYGLTVIEGAPAGAGDLAAYILSPEGQAVLADYGFGAPIR